MSLIFHCLLKPYELLRYKISSLSSILKTFKLLPLIIAEILLYICYLSSLIKKVKRILKSIIQAVWQSNLITLLIEAIDKKHLSILSDRLSNISFAKT